MRPLPLLPWSSRLARRATGSAWRLALRTYPLIERGAWAIVLLPIVVVAVGMSLLVLITWVFAGFHAVFGGMPQLEDALSTLVIPGTVWMIWLGSDLLNAALEKRRRSAQIKTSVLQRLAAQFDMGVMFLGWAAWIMGSAFALAQFFDFINPELAPRYSNAVIYLNCLRGTLVFGAPVLARRDWKRLTPGAGRWWARLGRNLGPICAGLFLAVSIAFGFSGIAFALLEPGV